MNLHPFGCELSAKMHKVPRFGSFNFFQKIILIKDRLYSIDIQALSYSESFHSKFDSFWYVS